MNKSTFILNDELQEIKSIIFEKGLLTIKTSKYILNIDLNFDITALKTNVRENISNRIYKDQNIIAEKYSYVINIGEEVYLTKNNNNYLLEVNIKKIDNLIPPFDKINNVRLKERNNYDDLEIHKLEAKIYFNQEYSSKS